ncbi:MAG: hypothetical protein M0005_11460 [Actinomycetota bacterium]|nr:hypothetical protein [Actinomycetota bacterium]
MDLTPDQLVAYNLAAARHLRGWTQTHAADMLSFIGPGQWSKVTLSAAETSVNGRRVRQFSATDLAQFSSTFDLPLIWWLLPPGPHDDIEIVTGPAALSYEPDKWLRVLFGDPANPAVAERLSAPWVHRYTEELARVASWPQARELADSLRTAAGVMETAARMAAPPPVRRPSPISRNKSKKAEKPAGQKEKTR